MKLTVSLVASLALNLLLLGWLPRTDTRDRHVAANEPAVGDQIEGLAADAAVPTGAEPPDEGRVSAFHWSQLDTSDWFAYRDGLLEVGCPAATVREIIEPGVRRSYVTRVRELAAPYVNRFWELAWSGDDATFESVKGSVHVLEEEQEKLLEDLFAGLPSDDGGPSASRASDEATLDFLAPSIRERLEELQQAHREELKKARALPDSDDRKARLAELRQQHQLEISSLLTPEEEDQWKLRTSRFAGLRELEGISLGEDELAEAIRIKERTAGDTHGLERTALAELLGTERAADFIRAQDDEFQSLLRMSGRLGATAEQARELWDLEQEARRLAEAANQDFERSETERLADLAGLRQHLASSVETLLGGKRGREMWEHSRNDWLGRTFRVAEDDPLASLSP